MANIFLAQTAKKQLHPAYKMIAKNQNKMLV
jgi:hypothetical protein